MSGFLDSLNLQSFTPDQQAELLASVQAAQMQGNQAQLQQVLMAQLQKFQLQNAQKELLQIQKSLADPAQAYAGKLGPDHPTAAQLDQYLMKGMPQDQQLLAKHKVPDAAMNDDRAQYKKTLNNFLARDAKASKKAADGGADTDSDEDGFYSKKLQEEAQDAD